MQNTFVNCSLVNIVRFACRVIFIRLLHARHSGFALASHQARIAESF
jgi:hypothetical protein